MASDEDQDRNDGVRTIYIFVRPHVSFEIIITIARSLVIASVFFSSGVLVLPPAKRITRARAHMRRKIEKLLQNYTIKIN